MLRKVLVHTSRARLPPYTVDVMKNGLWHIDALSEDYIMKWVEDLIVLHMLQCIMVAR